MNLLSLSRLGQCSDVFYNILDEGAIGDGVFDNGVSIRAAIAKAKLVASENNRPLIKIPPGEYLFTGQLDFGEFLDLDMIGAILLSATETNEPKVIFGSTLVNTFGGSYQGLKIRNEWASNTATGHKYDSDSLIGVQFINISYCLLQVTEIKFFTVAIQYRSTLSISHNILLLGNIIVCRIGIDFYGNDTGGWINENKFYGGNFQCTTSMNNYGSAYPVRMRSEVGGYLQHNANNFFGLSCQAGLPTAWSSGGSIAEKQRIYNGTTFNEYQATTTGESQTIGTNEPTHTSGTVTDNNGVDWLYLGACRRPILYCNGAGRDNSFFFTRWETGIGPALIVDGGVNVDIGKMYIHVSIKTGVIDILDLEDIDENHIDSGISIDARNSIASNEVFPEGVIALTDLHKKAITSSSGTTVPGLDHDGNTGNFDEEFTTDVDILWDGLHYKSTTHSNSFILNTTAVKRHKISFLYPDRTTSEFRVRYRVMNEEGVFYEDLLTVDRLWQVNISATTDKEARESSDNKLVKTVAVRPDVSYLRAHIEGKNDTVITGITIAAVRTKVIPENNYIPSIENLFPTDHNQRYAYGVPLVGAFLVSGELINNLNTSAAEPVAWRVKTTGYLANAWVTATAYVIGSLVEDSGIAYAANTAHTSGGTFAGDVANWDSLGAIAVIAEVISEIPTEGRVNLADYITDFTGTVNQQTEMTAAESDAFDNGYFLYHPGGTILFDSLLLRVPFIGAHSLTGSDDINISVIKTTITDGSRFIDIGQDDDTKSRANIENIVFLGTGTQTLGTEQNAIALSYGKYDVPETNADLCTRSFMSHIRIKGFATGLEMHGWINRVDNLHIVDCDVGAKLDTVNNCIFDMLFERNGQDFIIIDSHAVHFTRLLMEGATGDTASTIDNSSGVLISNLYLEDENKDESWIDVGFTTECSNFKILAGRIWPTDDAYPIRLDKVDGYEIDGRLTQVGRKIYSTTDNTKGGHPKYISQQFGFPNANQHHRSNNIALNLFPNGYMNGLRWGISEVQLTSNTLSTVATNSATGNQSLRIDGVSTATNGRLRFKLKDADIIAAAINLPLTLGVWIYIPDILAFDHTIVGYRAVSVSLTTLLADVVVDTETFSSFNEYEIGIYNFLNVQMDDISSAIDEIRVSIYTNGSLETVGTGEYIIVDSVVLASGIHQADIFEGRIIQSPDNVCHTQHNKLSIVAPKAFFTTTGEYYEDSNQSWQVGDIVTYTDAAAGEALGKYCTTAGLGTGSTWKDLASIAS